MSEPAVDERSSEGDDPARPNYKGAPLDSERGPGLGCFWIQIGLLVFLLIATPLSVWLAFPPWVSAAMLILTLAILFFVGQTMIFLLRLVAADRRAQRRPLREGARKTVGQLESETSYSDASATDAPLPAPQSQENDPRAGQG